MVTHLFNMLFGDVFGTVMIAVIAVGVTLIVGLISGTAVYLYLKTIDKIIEFGKKDDYDNQN